MRVFSLCKLCYISFTMNFKKTVLKNGLTIITVPMKDSPSVTVLVMVKTGSKYETKEINGLSHFLEHMCFKGTEKRPTALDISMELDGIGSQNNAFTGQEYTGYYAKAHPKHFSTILDVVSDIYLNPVFNSNEIEREKGVIIGELNMYEDMPMRNVSDVFMEVMYGDQPAGWSIVGTKENILNFKREDFIHYREKHYVASATTVFVSGSFDEELAIKEVEKVFSGISIGDKQQKSNTIEEQSKPNIKIKQKETDQTHVILGVRTFEARDDKNIILKVLSAILGEGMSSRLFQKLREEMGMGYYVRSGVDEYTDHGYLAVSTGVDNSRVAEAVRAIIEEMKKMANEKVEDSELNKAKEYMLGNLYLGLESSDSLAEYYAIQNILDEEILTPDELSKKIQAVTAEEVQNVAKEIFVDGKLNMAIVGNIKNKEELDKVFHF